MSDSTHPVVVGIDGTFTAIRAARWGAAVAESFEAPLLIVFAKPPRGHSLSDSVTDVGAADIGVQRKTADAILGSAEQAVRKYFRDVRITTAQADGAADEALVELSRSARLIVLGCDDVSLRSAILVGSTTTAVATHSTCPVVAWRGDEATLTRQPIVLGIDHDRDSQVAVKAAFEFADRLGLGIIAVHAWQNRRLAGDVAAPFVIDWNKVDDALPLGPGRRLKRR